MLLDAGLCLGVLSLVSLSLESFGVSAVFFVGAALFIRWA